jgi:hypothetical protein
MIPFKFLNKLIEKMKDTITNIVFRCGGKDEDGADINEV